jgi:hypothetical protein
MMRKTGDKIMITGGGELTPRVEVVTYRDPGSMHDGEPALQIEQGCPSRPGLNNIVQVSPKTLQAILDWYSGKE